ncbi:phosphonate ABC transporter, permease protein PhnE [Donghicola mangrovi]|uniref:Phosphonate ABC transporter, permease protein PhnE n=1 Tax=Donghicola mangrovi TaxID=2729614 RepID=A0A850QEC8_9RHOB|nr:phosphonate ABC transporter, permease protein PhnE [Donghicola mangrovi]NVO25280.1 phosphonate ABC transporter, permease protein PhnE [Donghicola mangrovi]
MTALSDPQFAFDTQSRIKATFARRKWRNIAVPLGILAYLVYVFFAFDVQGLAAKARPENASILLRDFWSYKMHVTRDNRSDTIVTAYEGERKGTFPEGQGPDWVSYGPETVISLRDGSTVTLLPENAARIDIPDFGSIVAQVQGRAVDLNLPADATTPDWMSVSRNRVAITQDGWRFSITPARTEVFRYRAGWELFFFTIDTPFYGKSLGELAALALWEPRVEPQRPNIVAMADYVWNNKMWRHGEVAWAMFETILMAFLGTMGAGLIALPLAFLAASNFAPARWVRLTCRRLFDFLRGVDGLIWTVILSRAFGPGPMTGSLAILLTDTGTFGKTFSEALENIDQKQVEGIQSTGANALQRMRFGVIPQVLPLILSQLLYYLESNTRSATVIGALVGGGIGLLLTQAIITQKDWEEVCYYMVLVVLTVMLMDTISGWIRRKFIKG